MTGAYLRAKRNGEWQPIEVEHLTPEERREVMKNVNHDTLHNWIDMLCAKICENEEILDELVKEGILQRK